MTSRCLPQRTELLSETCLPCYRKWEKNISGDMVERRWFETPTGGDYASYNPDATTPQWRQWLNRNRQNPPTPEELQA